MVVDEQGFIDEEVSDETLYVTIDGRTVPMATANILTLEGVDVPQGVRAARVMEIERRYEDRYNAETMPAAAAVSAAPAAAATPVVAAVPAAAEDAARVLGVSAGELSSVIPTEERGLSVAQRYEDAGDVDAASAIRGYVAERFGAAQPVVTIGGNDAASPEGVTPEAEQGAGESTQGVAPESMPQAVLSPAQQRKAKRAEIAKRIPAKGKTKLWTQAKVEDVAEYIATLTDDAATQQATADRYIADIRTKQEKMEPIEALELEDDIAFWNDVKAMLAQPAPATAPVVEGEAQNVESSTHNVEESTSVPESQTGNGTQNVEDNTPGTRLIDEVSKEGAIGRSLSEQEARSLIAEMESNAEVAPDIELNIDNWDALFGENGTVNTPIGEVKMGENQFTKLMRQDRNGKLGMIKPTLENPDAIIEDKSKAKEGDITERASSYVFVKAFKKADGSRYYYFTSVTVSKDGKEVIISNQEKRRNAIANLLENGKLVWKHADNVSSASDVANGLYSLQGNVSDLTTEGTDAPQTNGTINTPDVPFSEDESTTQSANSQENFVKSGENPGNEGEKDVIEEIKAELGILNRDNAAEYARRLFAVNPWNTLEEANAALKELLASYGEALNGQTLGVIPFLDEARNLISDKKVAEMREQNRVAEERQQRAGVPPRMSDYSAAINAEDTEAQKAWEDRFNDYLDKLTADDLPTIDATVRSMQGNKESIKAGNPDGYKENPNYKAFDYIEKALKKRKKKIEQSSLGVEQSSSNGEKSQEIEENASEQVTGKLPASENQQTEAEAPASEQVTGKLPASENQQTEAEAPAKEKAAEQVPVKIDDVGEKIGGARKDIIRQYADKIKLDGKTFSTMFPKPDIDKLVEAGLPKDKVAAVKAMYDNAKREFEIAKKRRGKDKALQASLFYAMYAKNVLTGEEGNFDLAYNGYVFTEWGKEFMKANIALYKAVFNKLGADYGKVDLRSYFITPLAAGMRENFNLKKLNEENSRMQQRMAEMDGRKVPEYKDGDVINFVGEHYSRPSDQFETLEEAVNTMVERISKEVKVNEAAQYKVESYWKRDAQGRADYTKAYLGIKVRGFGTVDVMEFKNMNEARAWLQDHREDFQQMAAAKEEQVRAEKKKPLPKYVLGHSYNEVQSQYSVFADFGKEGVRILKTFDIPQAEGVAAQAKVRSEVYKNEVLPYIKSEEAVQSADGIAQEIRDAKNAKPKSITIEKKSRERVGVDWRNGKDTTPEMFVDVEGKEPSVFGFRAIEFGNYVSQKERQQFLNDIYDALMDMSEILGVSPRALSLGGKLALAVGARGTSGASGHYEPYKNVINITKTRGAGVLAHEWLHALDRYFSNFDENMVYPNGTRYATQQEYADDTRQEVKDAFEKVMLAVKASDYRDRSMRLGEYWASEKELAARALQDYVIRKLEERGQKNDFLSNHVAPEEWDGDAKDYPFPLGEDVVYIGDAFDNFFATLQEKTTEDGNVVLYSIAEDAMLQDKGTKAFERATKTTMEAVERLKANGLEVKVVSEEEANAMIELAEMQRRKSPETALPEDKSSFKGTVISSDDGANILKDIDNAIAEYENKGNSAKTFIGDVARILRAVRHGSKSEYADIVTANGIHVRIRLADHNVKVLNYDNAGINNGISIVISRKPNEGITNNGDAHLVELFYSDKKISKADGKPLVEILKSIKQALYSGEYKDNTGLAVREEVNVPEFLRTSEGTVYGWSVDGRIYLTPEGVNPNTPVHEYTHLWASAIEQRNPELWAEVVEAVKLSPAWAEVAADAAYRNIWNEDNRMASEVLARLSGKENYRRTMQAAIERENDAARKFSLIAAWGRVKRALAKFWNKVMEMFDLPVNGSPGNDVAAWERFVDGAIGDFYKGVNPNVGTFSSENADIRYRSFGGNSGYVGYSMSKRAAEARKESRYPKTDFKKEYGVSEMAFNALVQAGVIENSEWHHTSSFGNRTTFYSWSEPEYAEYYAEHKKEIDRLSRENKEELQSLLDSVERKANERREREYEDFRKERALRDAYEAFVKNLPVPETFTAKNGVRIVTNGSRNSNLWEFYRPDGTRQRQAGKPVEELSEFLSKHTPSFDKWKEQLFESASVEDNYSDSERFSEANDDIRYREAEAEAARIDAAITDAVGTLAAELHTPVEMVTDLSTLPDSRKRGAKGWYDGGRVYLVLANAESVQDAVETVLHEVVGHKGLRVLFGDGFDAMLDDVFLGSSKAVRSAIVERAMPLMVRGKGNAMRVATEEYMAEQAERGFDDYSLWERVKGWFTNMLRSLGIDVEIGDNEIRYMLWRSYRRMKRGETFAEELNNKIMEVRFRNGDGTIAKYESRVNTRGLSAYNAREAFQDEMLALKEFQRIVEEKYGEKIPSYLNVYEYENRMSSVGFRDFMTFSEQLYEPLQETIDEMFRKGATQEDVTAYLIAKSGLERNRDFSVRDYLAKMQESKETPEGVTDAVAPMTKAEAEAKMNEYMAEKARLLAELNAGSIGFRYCLHTFA